MSDTPRTDAFYWKSTGISPVGRGAAEWADFARELEREVARLDVLHKSQYETLKAWRECARLNNSAMSGTVIRLRMALARELGEELNIPDAPSALDNLKSVAGASAAFDKLNTP